MMSTHFELAAHKGKKNLHTIVLYYKELKSDVLKRFSCKLEFETRLQYTRPS